MERNKVDNRALIEKAKEAMQFAYTPYSNFNVGAALLTATGKVYLGCNIENSSYGATNCAERTAIFKAISEGEREFIKIAVVSSSNAETYPCGICRQVLAEHMPQGSLLFEDTQGNIKEYSMQEILPYAFTKESMK